MSKKAPLTISKCVLRGTEVTLQRHLVLLPTYVRWARGIPLGRRGKEGVGGGKPGLEESAGQTSGLNGPSVQSCFRREIVLAYYLLGKNLGPVFASIK